jgi:hypothetical protein
VESEPSRHLGKGPSTQRKSKCKGPGGAVKDPDGGYGALVPGSHPLGCDMNLDGGRPVGLLGQKPMELVFNQMLHPVLAPRQISCVLAGLPG